MTIESRIQQHTPALMSALHALYGEANAHALAQHLLKGVKQAHQNRSQALLAQDNKVPAVSSHQWLGYTCYVDKFGTDLQGVIDKIPYLQSLGVNYLHLLSLLKDRDGDSDGGFAIADYTRPQPRLGEQDDFLRLTQALADAGILLCLDFVYNHTSDQHDWAKRAMAGEKHYQDFYYCFDSPEAFESYRPFLGEVFPQSAPGNFTFIPEMQRWVWTTFYPFQWDLNYHNPNVLLDMLNNLYQLANMGVRVFRMDAAAFSWKTPGTDCLNQPQTHDLLKVYRIMAQILSPGIWLKVEAIVNAKDAAMYLGTTDAPEGHIAYHNALMVSLWASLANQDAHRMMALQQSLPTLPPGAAWVNYARCHDDIGWNALSDDNAAPWSYSHTELTRLSQFYAGDSAHSYARGQSFQTENKAQVHGTNGTLAALCGIEQALALADEAQQALSLARAKLLHAMVLSFSGIPLLNMGDELALLNDYDYLDNPETQDGRWLHRPAFSQQLPHQTLAEALSRDIVQLAALRKQHQAFDANAKVSIMPDSDPAIYRCYRQHESQHLLILANFSDQAKTLILAEKYTNLITQRGCANTLLLPPYGFVWLSREEQT